MYALCRSAQRPSSRRHPQTQTAANGGNRQLVELRSIGRVITVITTPPRPDHVRGNTARLGEPPAPAQKGQNGVRVQVLQPDVQQTLFTAHTRAQPHAGGQLPV